ncbi:uncharacterized protein LOC143033178 [Oratosquilla oratoria]|uniref:uncharacterized protein LOC143033178 n=1 Tax=Oratosquilla oratoria TaxID=337810 RepID=UPI003F77316F
MAESVAFTCTTFIDVKSSLMFATPLPLRNIATLQDERREPVLRTRKYRAYGSGSVGSGRSVVRVKEERGGQLSLERCVVHWCWDSRIIYCHGVVASGTGNSKVLTWTASVSNNCQMTVSVLAQDHRVVDGWPITR